MIQSWLSAGVVRDNNNNNFIHVSIIKIAVIKPLSKDTT